MIFYATKQMMERYKLKTPETMETEMKAVAQIIAERERGNRLYEWGCKLFHFDRRKCLLAMHFETKLTVFLVDIRVADIEYAPDMVAQYIMDMYSNDKKMVKALEKYYASSPIAIFDKITDKSAISSLNRMLLDWDDGYRFYDYIENGILHTRKIMRDANRYPVTRKVNGNTEYFYASELFGKVIKEKFG